MLKKTFSIILSLYTFFMPALTAHAGSATYNEIQSGDFICESTGNGAEIKILSYTGTSVRVSIPGTINGLPVTAIDSYIFESRFPVEEIFIPASVKTISLPLGICPALTKIEVDEASQNFSCVDGVLFDKAVETLLLFPKNHKKLDYTMPETVTGIADYAFELNQNLRSLTFSASIKKIGSQAFSSCTAIEKISFPGKIPEIYPNAFEHCTNIKKITISGADHPIGDVIPNGIITASDARLALRVSARLEEVTDLILLLGDISRTGNISASDARKILRMSAGL